jgi:PTS system beta-glucosides-specific IIC component
MSIIEHWCNKHIPAVMRYALTPMIELLVAVPVTFLVIGPIASILQDWIGAGYQWLYSLNPTICGIILGGFWQVLVVFGLHWGIVPLAYVNLANYGRDTINAVTGPSNWAQAGAALGVALKTKNPELKQTALSAGVTGVMSITEPAIYGVNLKYKKPFYIALVFGAIAGGIAGAGNAADIAATGPIGLLSFPLFIGDGFIWFVIAMAVALAGSFAATYILYRDEAE